MNQGGFLTADERAGAVFQFNVKVKAGAEDVLAQEAHFAGLVDSDAQARDGQGVFGSDVDDAGVSADCVAADGHGFEDGVGVALQDSAVHECAGVAFVSIADHVLLTLGLGGRKLPFFASREAGAAAAAQVGVKHGLGDFLRLHRCQHLGQSLVAVPEDIVFDSFGVDAASVAQGDLSLQSVVRIFFVFRVVPSAFDLGRAFGGSLQAGFQNGRNLLRLDFAVNDGLAAVVTQLNRWLAIA